MTLDWTFLEKFPPKPSEAVCSTVFPYNFRPDVDNGIISGVAVDNVGIDVPIKFGDSMSNSFRDIRGAVFVSNERTNIGEAYPKSAKRGVSQVENSNFSLFPTSVYNGFCYLGPPNSGFVLHPSNGQVSTSPTKGHILASDMRCFVCDTNLQPFSKVFRWVVGVILPCLQKVQYHQPTANCKAVVLRWTLMRKF